MLGRARPVVEVIVCEREGGEDDEVRGVEGSGWEGGQDACGESDDFERERGAEEYGLDF